MDQPSEQTGGKMRVFAIYYDEQELRWKPMIQPSEQEIELMWLDYLRQLEKANGSSKV